MRALPPLPVFTVDEALAAGWTHSALRHAVRTGRLHRIRRGVYTADDRPADSHAVIAIGRAFPRGVVSHRSALLMHGLPLVGRRSPLPDLTLLPRSGEHLADVHLYRAQVRPRDRTLIGDIAVTSIARTLIDVARHRPLTTSVPAIDAALQRGLVTPADLDDVLLFCWNWPLIRRAHRAVRLCDGRSESPLESVSRLVLGWLGFPAPEPQKLIFDPSGRLIGRCDFYWDEVGVVGEADGRSKYQDREVLTAEKERQEQLEDLGLVVVRWGWDYVNRRPQALRERVRSGFTRGQLRDRSGFGRLWTL